MKEAVSSHPCEESLGWDREKAFGRTLSSMGGGIAVKPCRRHDRSSAVR
jgi:hypothetical protein